MHPTGFAAHPPMPAAWQVPQSAPVIAPAALDPLPPLSFAIEGDAGSQPRSAPPLQMPVEPPPIQPDLLATGPLQGPSAVDPPVTPAPAAIRPDQPAPAKRPVAPARPIPNFDKLPPNIAASLQRLAGGSAPPVSDKPDTDAAE
jgi:hypothetical protein